MILSGSETRMVLHSIAKQLQNMKPYDPISLDETVENLWHKFVIDYKEELDALVSATEKIATTTGAIKIMQVCHKYHQGLVTHLYVAEETLFALHG